MAKKYTRKQVSSLSQIDLEQERLKHKARRIEDEMLELLSPRQLLLSVAGKLVAGKIKRATKPRLAELPVPKAAKRKTQKKKNIPAGKMAAFASEPAVKKAAKKIGISFLRWQAFNLAWWAGKKIIRQIRQKHQKAGTA